MFIIKHSMNSLLVSISDVIRVHQKPIQLMMLCYVAVCNNYAICNKLQTALNCNAVCNTLQIAFRVLKIRIKRSMK